MLPRDPGRATGLYSFFNEGSAGKEHGYIQIYRPDKQPELVALVAVGQKQTSGVSLTPKSIWMLIERLMKLRAEILSLDPVDEV